MDHYKILGVNEQATPEEIKNNYRKLSMQYHPDRPNGDTEKFQKINEAYETLSDPQKRQMYHLKRNNPFSGGGAPDADILNMLFGGMFPPGMGGMGGMRGMGRNNPHVRIFHGMPFSSPHGPSFSPHGPSFSPLQRPTPIVKTITITIHQAFTGYNYPLEIERWVQNNGRKHTEKEKIYVDIPPGIDTNEILVMRNKGNVINDNNKGDIKIFIKIEDNPEFERNGLDLIYKKKISLKESLVGFKFDIKFINNKTYIINNNGVRIIKPGYEKIIPGMGMIRGEKRGDFVVKFEIEFPNDLTPEQKKKLNDIL